MPLTQDEIDARDERRRLNLSSKLTAKIDGVYAGGASARSNVSPRESDNNYVETSFFDRTTNSKQHADAIAQTEASRSRRHEVRKSAAPRQPAASAQTRLLATQATAARLEARVKRQVAARALASDGNLIEQARVAATDVTATPSGVGESSSAGATSPAGRRGAARTRSPVRRSDSSWTIHKPRTQAPEDYALLEKKMLEQSLGSRDAAESLIAQRDKAMGAAVDKTANGGSSNAINVS